MPRLVCVCEVSLECESGEEDKWLSPGSLLTNFSLFLWFIHLNIRDCE